MMQVLFSMKSGNNPEEESQSETSQVANASASNVMQTKLFSCALRNAFFRVVSWDVSR
jgi:hypothetical protein